MLSRKQLTVAIILSAIICPSLFPAIDSAALTVRSEATSIAKSQDRNWRAADHGALTAVVATPREGDLADHGFDSLLKQLKEAVSREAASPKPEGLSRLTRPGLATLRTQLKVEDTKNRAKFHQTEEAIKQKSLPPEILERHWRFVREYELRVRTLHASLDHIEQAQSVGTDLRNILKGQSGELQQAIKQTNALLGTWLTPRRRGFDPRNLPNRLVKEGQSITPRLTREEWLAAFPAEQPKRARNRFPDSLSSDPANPADLAETIEVKFTSEIRQLANTLERNPVRIFNWVRNNIDFVPTWGSIQGAQSCLESRVCNSFDTSSLLITMLRVSNIPARYQLGTIEVPIERFKNWAGGFSDADAAASLFASGGVPSVVRRVDQSGQVVTVKLEHAWVRAFVDYAPSGGAVNLQGDTWVDLDASFKQYVVNPGLQDLTAVVPFSRDAYLSSTTTKSPVAFYREVLTDYVRQNFPGRTLEEFLTTRTIRSSEPSLLSGGLPYRPLIRGVSFADLPPTLRQQITIHVAGGGAQTVFTRSLPEILGKRLTLSFMPATASDVAAALGFAGMYLTPPYLMSVRPAFRLEGEVVTTGAPVGMAQSVDMTFILTLANGTNRTVHNEITAGNYITFFPAPHFVSDRFGERVAREFRRTDNRFGTLNVDNSDRDPWIGGGLQGLGGYYFNRLDASINSLKEFFPVGQLKTAFIAYTSSDVEVTSLFGAPSSSSLKSMSIDADVLEDFAVGRDGQAGPVMTFEMLRGLESSFWEHAIFEAAGLDPQRPGISTVKILKLARATGIQVFEVNTSNIDSIEPQLQLSSQVKEEVRDGVNAGLKVIIPAANVQLGGWRGVGYIVEDPQTGAGAYQITGGLSGGGLALEQPGLGGGTLPPQQPLWPSAVLAVGTPLLPTLRGVIDQMINNSWSVLYEIGLPLYAAGHNVYVKEVFEDDIVAFVTGTGAPTDNDVFFYVGHGFNGSLVLPYRESPGYRAVGPGEFSGRHFRIVLLSACATGGDCTGILLDDVIGGCTPNPGYQNSWEAALLGPTIGNTRHGEALVGSVNSIRSFQAAPGNRIFFTAMAAGVSVGAAESFIESSYLRGDPTTTLQGFGR